MNEHLVYWFNVSFLVAFYSGLPGLWIAQIMRKKDSPFFYAVKNFELTKNDNFYKLLGLNFFTFCLKNSFFRHFNKKIKLTKRPTGIQVNDLINEITLSEICHVFGFLFVLIFQILVFIKTERFHVLVFASIFNIIFNVYPVLLQERNKSRFKNLLMVSQH